MRHEREGEQETVHEAEQMGVVVDHGQQADDEEEQQHCQQLEEGRQRTAEDAVGATQLHEQAGQNAELRPCRTRLWWCGRGLGFQSPSIICPCYAERYV